VKASDNLLLLWVELSLEMLSLAFAVLVFGTLQAGAASKTFQPSVGAGGGLTIPKSPPAIRAIQAARDGAEPDVVTAEIALSSTLREVTSITVQFNVKGIQLSCGAVSACAVSGSTITLDVKPLFDAWFAGDTTFGSLSVLRLPMSIQGSFRGTISVTLRNSQGASNTFTFSP
jgi:hypothetical protein